MPETGQQTPLSKTQENHTDYLLMFLRHVLAFATKAITDVHCYQKRKDYLNAIIACGLKNRCVNQFESKSLNNVNTVQKMMLI